MGLQQESVCGALRSDATIEDPGCPVEVRREGQRCPAHSGQTNWQLVPAVIFRDVVLRSGLPATGASSQQLSPWDLNSLRATLRDLAKTEVALAAVPETDRSYQEAWRDASRSYAVTLMTAIRAVESAGRGDIGSAMNALRDMLATTAKLALRHASTAGPATSGKTDAYAEATKTLIDAFHCAPGRASLFSGTLGWSERNEGPFAVNGPVRVAVVETAAGERREAHVWDTGLEQWSGEIIAIEVDANGLAQTKILSKLFPPVCSLEAAEALLGSYVKDPTPPPFI
jgi:hypothetical protein